MKQNEVTISKVWRIGSLALGLALGGYAQQSAAIKVVRDPTVSPMAQPPKAAQPAPEPAPNLPHMSAEQIVEKNVEARGGLAKWRAVQSMELSGKLDAGGKVDTLLPYKLDTKRPNKQRLAIEFAGHTALQVFDGKNGWKLRPYLNRADPEPFSPEELRKTQEAQDFDGQLIDYQAKGNKIELDGTEMVQGKPTYRLKVTEKEGYARRVWLDASTFLEVKVEGHARKFDGKMRSVETYLSDYRDVQGLKIPFVSETHVQGVRESHKMTVEKVALNPQLDDSLFGKPAPAQLPPQRVFEVVPGATASNSTSAVSPK